MTDKLWRAELLAKIVSCFMLLFVVGGHSWCFLGSGKKVGGGGLEVNNVHSHCQVPKAAETGII